MSRPHEYHLPNAPDSFGDDPESDLELDANELGPGSIAEAARGDGDIQKRLGNRENEEARQIPLRNLRPGGPRTSRRTRRYEEEPGDDGSGANGGQSHMHGPEAEDASESFSVGDATPLLNYDVPAQPARPRSGIFGGRVHIPGFMSRRSGYTNLSDPDAEAHGEASEIGTPRNIDIGQHPPARFPPNTISNAKYSPWDFLPRTLYNEFSFFINLYFLFVALSQLIPALAIGILWTYMAPLVFVLVITLGKEAFDDIQRRRRDREANKELYVVLRVKDLAKYPVQGNSSRQTRQRTSGGREARSAGQRRMNAIEEEEEVVGNDWLSNIQVDEVQIKSRDLKVGDILKLGKDQRVPADMVILKSIPTESSVTIAEPASEQLGAEHLDLQDRDKTSARPQASTSSLRPTEGNDVGDTFIRTDQLDGETDWKLRMASPLSQALDLREFTRLTVTASKPSRKVNEFIGRLELRPMSGRGQRRRQHPTDESPGGLEPSGRTAPLSIDNTAWANTILASSATVLGVIVYTGSQTRQALSTSSSRSKLGLLELEINNLTKFLCILTLTLSAVLVAFLKTRPPAIGVSEPQPNGKPDNIDFREQQWYISITRFLILFSSIIPISLRVNLDLGKSVYAYYIERDKEMPGAVVRTSTIPEDLGRIEYLLSDKTGTLTQNEMDLKKIHVGTVSYANEAMEEVSSYVRQGFGLWSQGASQPGMLVTPSSLLHATSSSGTTTRTRREIGSRVRDIVLALALCHNVTPTNEKVNGENVVSYQASSPDEIAIVRWTESVGLRVVQRDRHSIALQSTDSSRICVRVRILDIFPFTSEGKRMGIVLHFLHGSDSTPSIESGEIWFYQKGADTVMTTIVAANDWLDEETANMAREGLRTLVVGRRKLSPQQYQDFAASYKDASLSFQNRDANVASVIRNHLEHNLELLGVTGVEDKLQRDVKPSLELLRNAGIKIWMLTGDKVETARCVAISSKLVSRSQHIHTITALHIATRTSPTAASDTLSLLAANPDSTALLIDGDSLSYLLNNYRQAFISLAVLLPAVIACRCSPTQKADVALLIRAQTKKRICCIGDGGNDVSMIQAADVGVGIVGKEGRQASLAADFSITQFHHLTKLLVWHGRNSYKRSAKLAQFVIHRGLIISTCQTVFSIATHFEPRAIFQNWLIVGYATLYTQAPLFSLVLDRDVDETLANLYPELYKELTPGSSLSYRTFLIWLAVSIYQGSMIQVLATVFVGAADGGPLIAVAFTALVLTELVMVAMEVTTWHWIMVVSIVGTAVVYAGTVPFLGAYFDLAYVLSWRFAWQVAATCAVSLVPPYVFKVVRRTLRPPSYRKVRGV